MNLDRLNKPHAFIKIDNPPPVAFFNAVWQRFTWAKEAIGGSDDRFYSIGGHTIRLCFAGSALMPYITPAFEHLVARPVYEPSLTVCLWDSSSTDTDMPPVPWTSDDYMARGEIRGYNNDHIHTTFHLGSGALSMMNTRMSVALFWVHDFRQIPVYERGAPLRTILFWWMNKHNRQLIHAGAVGTPKGGVLLAGKGGSGKSTTALASINSELLYAGDDYVLLGREQTPFVYSLYNSAKLDAYHIKRLSHLLSNHWPSGDKSQESFFCRELSGLSSKHDISIAWRGAQSFSKPGRLCQTSAELCFGARHRSF